jgi:transcriptional regulator with XRE-family HTH domain
MLNSDIEKARVHKAQQLKRLRALYGITLTAVSVRSGLSVETIYRIESGSKTWTVDSEMSYLLTIDRLIDESHEINPKLTLLHPPKPPILALLKKSL